MAVDLAQHTLHMLPVMKKYTVALPYHCIECSQLQVDGETA